MVAALLNDILAGRSNIRGGSHGDSRVLNVVNLRYTCIGYGNWALGECGAPLELSAITWRTLKWILIVLCPYAREWRLLIQEARLKTWRGLSHERPRLE